MGLEGGGAELDDGRSRTSPAWAASAWARLSRDEISVIESTAPRTAKPAPTRNASWKPCVSAFGSAAGSPPADCIRLSVFEFAIEARIARPSAPPTCCDVLISPDARPASCGATPLTAPIVIGTKAKPSPTAAISDGNRMSPT